jgi:hypothetical protein
MDMVSFFILELSNVPGGNWLLNFAEPRVPLVAVYGSDLVVTFKGSLQDEASIIIMQSAFIERFIDEILWIKGMCHDTIRCQIIHS